MDGKQFKELDKRLKAIEKQLGAVVQLLELQAVNQGMEQQLIEALMSAKDTDPLQAYFNQGFFQNE